MEVQDESVGHRAGLRPRTRSHRRSRGRGRNRRVRRNPCRPTSARARHCARPLPRAFSTVAPVRARCAHPVATQSFADVLPDPRVAGRATRTQAYRLFTVSRPFRDPKLAPHDSARKVGCESAGGPIRTVSARAASLLEYSLPRWQHSAMVPSAGQPVKGQPALITRIFLSGL